MRSNLDVELGKPPSDTLDMADQRSETDSRAALRLFFDTQVDWIETLRSWAASDHRVAEVWVFGSRATGKRSIKDTPDPVPDLDVGYTLTGEDSGERWAYAICEVGPAKQGLQAQIPVKLDLQYAEPETDTRVWPAILDHGIKIYPEEPLD